MQVLSDSVKKVTYEDACKEGIGKTIVYKRSGSEYNITSSMNGVYFRQVNTGDSTFSLIETDYAGGYSFHFDNILVTERCLGVYLDIILRKDFKLVSKVKAFVSLYRYWNKEC